MLHIEHHAGLAADVCAEVVGSGTQFHLCQVAQTKYFAFLGSAYDDVLELLHVVEQAVELDVYLVGGTLQTADGDNKVLLVDGSDYFVGRYAVEAHQVGLQPDAHAILLAHHHRSAYAGNTADGGHDVDVEVVGDE